MKRVFFLVLPDVHVLDLAGPLQIMCAMKELRLASIEARCIGPVPRVRSFQGTWLDGILPLPGRLARNDVVFVIGSKLTAETLHSPAWRDAVQWLRSVVPSAHDSVRICSVCTGSFVLGHAGLLDGHLCTTHHDFTDRLRIEFPKAHVLENRLFVRHGRLTTSAGVAAGIDMALGLIAEEFGGDAALKVARENVVHFRRFSDDPALRVALRYRAHGNRRIHQLQDYLSAHVGADLKAEESARLASLSTRQLARVFRAETGTTVKQYQMELRTELARRLIIDSSLPLEEIVFRCGFGSVQGFRANWNKRETLSPLAYRRAHQSQRESKAAVEPGGP